MVDQEKVENSAELSNSLKRGIMLTLTDFGLKVERLSLIYFSLAFLFMDGRLGGEREGGICYI